jgi:ElaB/YqjD/DUF883 family membrane-anchored ribosome-binding protein
MKQGRQGDGLTNATGDANAVITDIDTQVLKLRGELEAILMRQTTPTKRQAKDKAKSLASKIEDLNKTIAAQLEQIKDIKAQALVMMSACCTNMRAPHSCACVNVRMANMHSR